MEEYKDGSLKYYLIPVGLVASLYLLSLLIGAWWLGIGLIGIGLIYFGWVLYNTNWCKPGECNGIFFIPGMIIIIVGLLFIFG